MEALRVIVLEIYIKMIRYTKIMIANHLLKKL